MFIPGQPISISTKDRDFLGAALSDHLDSLEAEYSSYFNDIRVWWTWYEAKPKAETKDFPFRGASNIVVPMIKGHTNAMVNRLYGMIFSAGERVWTGRTENEAMQQHVRDILRFINWAAHDNDFNYRMSIYEWLSELVPIGSSVLALNWREDIRPIFADPKGRSAQMIRYSRGPIFEHAPRESYLWDTTYPIADAPFVSRAFEFSWSEINHLASLNGWDESTVEKLRHQEGLTSDREAAYKSKREADSVLQSFTTEPHDIREVHVDWPVLKASGFTGDLATPGNERLGQASPPLVAVIHRKTRQLLHLKAEPYNLPYKPFFDGYFRKRPGRGHSVGLAKDLYHMQLGTTVLLNQTIDARTRANSLWAKTSRRDLLQKPLDPRHPVYVPEGTTFEEMNLNTNVLQDTAIFNQVNIIAERLTGQADPAFGRESRQGGHPSPATSTLALMNKSEEMVGTTRELIRLQISRMGEAVASLYQQFETNDDGRLTRVLGQGDAQRVADFLFPSDPIFGLMKFDVVGMNDTSNPQAEIQRLIQLRQSNMNYWAFLGQAVQALVQSKQAGLKDIEAMIVQSIKAQTQFEQRVLEIGGIDDTERFIAQLSTSITQANVGSPAGQLGPGGPGAGPAAGPGLAGPSGSNGSGTAGPVGGPRLQ